MCRMGPTGRVSTKCGEKMDELRLLGGTRSVIADQPAVPWSCLASDPRLSFSPGLMLDCMRLTSQMVHDSGQASHIATMQTKRINLQRVQHTRHLAWLRASTLLVPIREFVSPHSLPLFRHVRRLLSSRRERLGPRVVVPTMAGIASGAQLWTAAPTSLMAC